MGLSRGATQIDTNAYFYLQPHIENDALVAIERAQVPAQYFRSMVATLEAARIYDKVVLISYLGQMSYPALVEIAQSIWLQKQAVQGWFVFLVRGDSLSMKSKPPY